MRENPPSKKVVVKSAVARRPEGSKFENAKEMIRKRHELSPERSGRDNVWLKDAANGSHMRRQ